MAAATNDPLFTRAAQETAQWVMREMQAQNLTVMADKFTSHPVLGPMTKAASLYRKTVEAHMLTANEIVMTDDEIKAEQQKQAESQQQDPELIKLGLQVEIATMEANTKLQIAQMERETRQMTLAETNNMTVAKLQVMLGIKQIETGSKEKMLAAEAIIEQRLAAQGVTSGSGGHFSAGKGS